MIKEFKEFISKGNVIDMAVGVIIAGAFGKIVTSVVNDLMMPLLGLLTGGINFSALSVTLRDGETPLVLNYGAFVQNIIDFFIIAIAVFLFVRAFNKYIRKRVTPPAEQTPPTVSREAELLAEIKELLEKNTPPDNGGVRG